MKFRASAKTGARLGAIGGASFGLAELANSLTSEDLPELDKSLYEVLKNQDQEVLVKSLIAKRFMKALISAGLYSALGAGTGAALGSILASPSPPPKKQTKSTSKSKQSKTKIDRTKPSKSKRQTVRAKSA